MIYILAALSFPVRSLSGISKYRQSDCNAAIRAIGFVHGRCAGYMKTVMIPLAAFTTLLLSFMVLQQIFSMIQINNIRKKYGSSVILHGMIPSG